MKTYKEINFPTFLADYTLFYQIIDRYSDICQNLMHFMAKIVPKIALLTVFAIFLWVLDIVNSVGCY